MTEEAPNRGELVDDLGPVVYGEGEPEEPEIPADVDDDDVEKPDEVENPYENFEGVQDDADDEEGGDEV
jgi:hypothetical protein